MYQSYAKNYTERFAAMKLTPADLGFADDEHAAWPEIALRFTLAQPGVSCAIIGTTNPDNAAANIAAARKGALEPRAVARIRAAFKAADPSGAWEGLT
jgi:aryl-alcohol dehydrogenase-like predicted oxidoreductase